MLCLGELNPLGNGCELSQREEKEEEEGEEEEEKEGEEEGPRQLTRWTAVVSRVHDNQPQLTGVIGAFEKR